MDSERMKELVIRATRLTEEDIWEIHDGWRGPDNSLKREDLKQALRIVRALELGYAEKEEEISNV